MARATRTDFEKLGVFYLGRPWDPEARKAKPGLVLYDSKDLVTHAVCVGMTGSGKTGLCLALLEEAALDGIPALVIDPKGDLANLMLTFPDLRPEDFLPWIDEDDARRKGLEPADYARQQAERWTTGLAEWGQDGARIRRLREAVDIAIYTPGSEAGIPVSMLGSFAAPPPAIRADGELLRERVGGTATSLLALLGTDADPVKSREHILISTILDAAWREGRDLDLAGLIQAIQAPPVSRVGVLDLESFYPSKDRFALALSLNNLLASPEFAAWTKGEALDVGRMLRTPEGKPRIAICSIAHLGDAERMFFVSLALNQMLAWTRAQSGTTSLRAILYMDEIFGYFPPVANPPSKLPLLTLLKQARAFGVGVVLATQNPVDLDYKGLANAGTWFVGRLQTERDKARVLEGLEGAAADAGARFDKSRMDEILAGLGNRIFLMNNVHDDGPEVFETRWAMSYLRGPLTRAQIKTLMSGRASPSPPEVAAPPPRVSAPEAAAPAQAAGRPVLPRARRCSIGRCCSARPSCASPTPARASTRAGPLRSWPPSRARRWRWTGKGRRRCRWRRATSSRRRPTAPASPSCRRSRRGRRATTPGARSSAPGCSAPGRSTCSRARGSAPSRGQGRRRATSARASSTPTARGAIDPWSSSARSTRRRSPRSRRRSGVPSRRSHASPSRRPRRASRRRSRSGPR
jgi:hypothetical protein